MTCLEFEKVVREVARGDLSGAGGMAHADTCARCARRLANEKMLSAAMAATRADDADLTAPAAVEQRLIEVFREGQAAFLPRRRAWWARAAVAAIAAGLVVAAVVGLRKPAERHIVQPQPREALRAPVVAPVPAVAPVIHEAHPACRAKEASGAAQVSGSDGETGADDGFHPDHL